MVAGGASSNSGRPLNRATRAVASTLGVVAGITGIEHGVGEVLQGNVQPAGVVIESWPDSELYNILAGEPAMTIIPSLLVSGISSILVSVVLMVWAIRFIDTRHGGLGLILLSFTLLLVGGGFGPPVIGVLVGLAGTRIHSELSWLKKRVPADTLGLASRLWRGSFAACVFGLFSLWPGSIMLVYLFGLASEFYVTFFSFLSFSALFTAIFLGFVVDCVNKGSPVIWRTNPNDLD